MSQKPKACDVSGPMTVVLAHQLGSVFVQMSHRLHSEVVSILSVFTRNKGSCLGPLAALLSLPLIQVHCHLSAERFSEDQYVPRLPVVRPCILTFMAHHIGHTSYDGPGVHYALAAGDQGVGLTRAVVETSYHLTSHDLSIVL